MQLGILYALLAYIIWGLLPLYIKSLHGVAPLEILLHRMVWSLAFLGAILLWRRHFGWLREVAANPRLILNFAASAGLLCCNWFLYIWAVSADRVVDASLGYFINPLFSVLLGVLLLHERLRPLQWLSIAMAAAGVFWLTWSAGQLPWIALGLAASFGGYGLPGLETDVLAKFRKYTVVTTANLPLGRTRKEMPAAERKGSFVSVNEEAMYDAGVRYEDLVGAAVAVVTKPGYGIVSECVANDTAVLYTSRGHFPEYDVMVDEMPKYVRSAFIGHDDLFAGKWESALDKLLAQPKIKKKPETNGAEVAAEILLKALDKPPKKPRGRPKAKA